MSEEEVILNETEEIQDNEKEEKEPEIDYKDLYLRERAEMENFRKRLMKDKEESVNFVQRRLLQDISEMLSEWERAVESAKKESDLASVQKGIVMTNNKWGDFFVKNYQLEAFGEPGEAFNPLLHEAIFAENPDAEEKTIVEVYQKGYKWKNAVIKTAKVKI